jgi:hypothetical protein
MQVEDISNIPEDWGKWWPLEEHPTDKPTWKHSL